MLVKRKTAHRQTGQSPKTQNEFYESRQSNFGTLSFAVLALFTLSLGPFFRTLVSNLKPEQLQGPMVSESTPLTNIASTLLTKENAEVAGNFAKEKFLELRKQASDGDYSIRLLALLGGIVLIGLSATEFLGKILTLHLVAALIEVYTFLLGVVVLILEGKGQIPFFPDHLATTIQKYAMILRYVWGRGALYFVAGTLQLSQLGLFDLIGGGFMTFVGVVYIVVGTKARAKLRELKDSTIPESTLKARFHQATSKNTDKLDMPSFKTLVLTLGLHLNRRETETAFLIVDQDDDGLISYSEFQAWWHALDEPGAFQLV